MTLSTSALRSAWAPACTPKGTVFLNAYAALDAVFQAHSYRPTGPDCGAYNCRKITGGTGYSLHSYGPGDPFTFWTGLRISTALAVDINWQDNPYGRQLVTDMPRAMVDAVLRIRTRNGQQVWRWGGDYRTNKDAMHFEIVCAPRDLGTGIDPTTLPGTTPAKPTPPKPAPVPGDSDMARAYRIPNGEVWLCTGTHREHINETTLNERAVMGLVAPVPADAKDRDDKYPQWVRKTNTQGEKILRKLKA